nr:ATP synthase F0 subunit 8 [Amorphoscelis chinensis]
MPQMMPLSWLILFMFFFLMLILFSVMNYFSTLNKPLEKQFSNLKTKSLNWKW